MQRFPELKAGAERGKLWTRNYFVATAGNVGSEVIKRYVEEAKSHAD